MSACYLAAKQADELQLCAQAMCLEEKLCCSVPEGARIEIFLHRVRQSKTREKSLASGRRNLSYKISGCPQ